jgi:hypothetical protein
MNPSGLRLTLHAELPPAERITPEDVFINGETLDLEREYDVVVKQFVAEGGDG